jgi:hypothetical protein
LGGKLKWFEHVLSFTILDIRMYSVDNIVHAGSDSRLIEKQTGQTTRENFIQKTERIFSQMSKKEPEEVEEKKVKLFELLVPVRYKPISVKQLAKETKFSVAEVKLLYRAFKQECPTGISSE